MNKAKIKTSLICYSVVMLELRQSNQEDVLKKIPNILSEVLCLKEKTQYVQKR